MTKVKLHDVTLCAIASTNIEQTVFAISRSMSEVDFERVLLFTDRTDVEVPPSLTVISIDKIKSSAEYSNFVIRQLGHHIETDFVLIVQWDGFVIDGRNWLDDFRRYDYVGASWPQFHDGHHVGNGGFSLRSRRLLEACRDPRFASSHPEDVSICRENRLFLEECFGIRFADKSIADRFSYERYRHNGSTFGFHGAFNIISAAGFPAFCDIYARLNDKRSIYTDFWSILGQTIRQSHQIGWRRSIRIIARLISDYCSFTLTGK